MEVFDVLKDRLSTDQSRLKYLGYVQQFYDHQVRFQGAKYNPLNGANDQFRQEIDNPDNKTVDAEGMRAIYEVTESVEEELLVLALGAWGLRPSEVASLTMISSNSVTMRATESSSNSGRTVPARSLCCSAWIS
jgi:hypothetical protein